MKLVNKIEIIKTLDNSIAILPTDTVYGIMGKFNRTNEIKINQFKNSDINKKISVIFYNKKELFNYIDNLNIFRKIIIFLLLPGKYTFIVNLKKDFCYKNGFDRTDFGVRITKNKSLQSVIKNVGPLLATSCNRSGEMVYTNIKEIEKGFKSENIDVFYEGELKNKSSKIYDLSGDKVKRIR